VLTVALDEAFDQFPDGLSVLTAVRDDEGTIVDFLAVYANAALERISGMRIEEIVDHRLLDFVPAFRDAGPFEAYRDVVETGVPGRWRSSSMASWAARASRACSRCAP
jgi:PAS domain-containing protein